MNSTLIEPSGIGRRVFRWRSYLPILVVLALLVGLGSGRVALARVSEFTVAGLLLAGLGLALRVYAVGHAPPGTSGRHRTQHAAMLNTFGIYSILRHPLYLGNILVWAGVSATSGWPLGTAASSLAAVAMFAIIVHHEDAFLAARFGDSHREWAAATPAFLPRPDLYRTSRRPFEWARAVASEYSTLHSIGLLALLLAAARDWGRSGSLQPTATWWALAAANSALYVSLRAWRAARRRRAARP